MNNLPKVVRNKSLSIHEQQLGADHPDTATSLNNLAELYKSMGRYSDAEPLYVRALAIRERILGTTHPDTVSTRERLANLRQAMEERRKGEGVGE